MSRRTTSLAMTAGILTVAVQVMPRNAQAGPPLICFPMEIGNAPSLPWGTGSGWHDPRNDYELTRLVADTLTLLSPDAPVLARMETLRRATIYASKNPAIARELLLRLNERAAGSGPPGDKAPSLVLFDVGYLMEIYKQAQPLFTPESVAAEQDGYSRVLSALQRRGRDPEMEYAAALITVSRPKAVHAEHLRKALAGAPDGSPLARTISAHSAIWGHRIEGLRIGRKVGTD